jgi:hypothetical protein
MRGRRTFQLALVVVATGAAVLIATPASATAAGTASAGSASIVRSSKTIPVAPVAPCSLTGQKQGSSSGASKNGLVSYGPSSSTCSRDKQAHTSSSTAKGSGFSLSALQNYGGPLIKVATYQVSCTATQNGTNASWSFSGLTGVTIPKQVPQNYTVKIKFGNTLLADVILNEVVFPDPNDGSITLNMMHIVLFPNGTPPHSTALSGDIYVGSAACSPTV